MTDERNDWGYPCTKEETCVWFPADIQVSELKWMAHKLGLELEYKFHKGFKAVRRGENGK